MARILVVEDDEILREGILFALAREGHQVRGAGSLAGMKEQLGQPADLVVLDVSLPDGDSREFLPGLRESNPVPVIFLTARNTEGDMIAGFDAGADDYITKPFSLEELYLRIQARIRQYYQIPSRQKIFEFFPLRINLDARTIQIQDNRVPLTMSEFDILVLLAQTPEHVYTISEIYQRVWKMPDMNSTHTVQVHIANLRKKLEEAWGDHMFIQTVWGKGYKFVEPPVSG